MQIARWLGAAALAWSLAACGGGDDDNDDNDGRDYDTARDFLVAVAEVFCEKLDECGQLGENSVSQCRTEFVDDTCEAEGVDCNAPPPDGVTDEDIERCLDDTVALSCPVSRTMPLPASCALGPSEAAGASRSAWGSAAAR